MKKITSYTLLFIVLLLLFYFSLGKSPLSAHPFPGFDKMAHFIMYAFLCAILWYRYYKSNIRVGRLKILLCAIVAPLLLSGMIELFQEYMTTNRSGDFTDFMFNALGVLFAAMVGRWVIKPLVRKR